LIGCLPFTKEISPLLFSTKVLSALLALVTLLSSVTAWTCVSGQRRGGGRRQSWVKALFDRLVDILPRRSKDFSSPAEAQFWFEWRRTGLLLPFSIGAMLILVIAPLSWCLRSDAGATV